MEGAMMRLRFSHAPVNLADHSDRASAVAVIGALI